MLNNMLVWISSEIADGNRHNHDDKPILLAGRLGGLVTPDRHVRFPTNRDYTKVKTYGDFFITLFSLYDVPPVDNFRRRREGGDRMAKLTTSFGVPVVAAALLSLSLGAGCNGKIGSSGGSPGTGAGTGTGSGTGAGAGPGLGGANGGITGIAGSGAVVTTPPPNAGVVVVRRLNHDEYNNTVRDLLGTSLTPATGFPADDLGAEFDTVGSALSLSPGLRDGLRVRGQRADRRPVRECDPQGARS